MILIYNTNHTNTTNTATTTTTTDDNNDDSDNDNDDSNNNTYIYEILFWRRGSASSAVPTRLSLRGATGAAWS